MENMSTLFWNAYSDRYGILNRIKCKFLKNKLSRYKILNKKMLFFLCPPPCM